MIILGVQTGLRARKTLFVGIKVLGWQVEGRRSATYTENSCNGAEGHLREHVEEAGDLDLGAGIT